MNDQPKSSPLGVAPDSSNGNGSEPSPAQQGERPPLLINAQYVKDLSFEAPAAPGIFSQMQQHQPDISVKVDVQARTLSDEVYEVVLHIRSDCKAGDMVVFVVELEYGGVFTLNVPEQEVRPVLLIECPRVLFPFARQIVAMATLNGGFMPLMLNPIDFVGLYQQQEGGTAQSISVA